MERCFVKRLVVVAEDIHKIDIGICLKRSELRAAAQVEFACVGSVVVIKLKRITARCLCGLDIVLAVNERNCLFDRNLFLNPRPSLTNRLSFGCRNCLRKFRRVGRSAACGEIVKFFGNNKALEGVTVAVNHDGNIGHPQHAFKVRVEIQDKRLLLAVFQRSVVVEKQRAFAVSQVGNVDVDDDLLRRVTLIPTACIMRRLGFDSNIQRVVVFSDANIIRRINFYQRVRSCRRIAKLIIVRAFGVEIKEQSVYVFNVFAVGGRRFYL